MKLSGPDNENVIGVCEGITPATKAPVAPLEHFADPIVASVQAATARALTSPEDPAQARGVRARPQVRREARGRANATREESILVREHAYRQVRALIVSGRMPPGQRLAEEHLAKEFGVSRTPIREALHKLETEGLITPLPTRGFATFRNAQQDVDEITELRALFEGYALRLICSRLSHRQLRRLEAMLRKTEDALMCRRVHAVSRWNDRFHNALHALVGDKRRLYKQLVALRQCVFRNSGNAPAHCDRARWTVEEHRRILMALRFRDADLCESVMRAHIDSSRGHRLQPARAEVSRLA